MTRRIPTGLGDLETTTRWKSDGRLVVKAKTERGTEIVETYEMDPYNPRLQVTIETEGGRGPGFSYRRVYDFVKRRNTPAAR